MEGADRAKASKAPEEKTRGMVETLGTRKEEGKIVAMIGATSAEVKVSDEEKDPEEERASGNLSMGVIARTTMAGAEEISEATTLDKRRESLVEEAVRVATGEVSRCLRASQAQLWRMLTIEK